VIRTGRILLVEPEEQLRTDLSRRLAEAGHDVAAVPDDTVAELVLGEGLDPDVIVGGSDRGGPGGLFRDLAPRAVRLHLDRRPSGIHVLAGGQRRDASGPGSPGDVVRQVEEVLLEQGRPADGEDDAVRSLDLARRLANALPRTGSPEERIELLVDSFHSYFGVRGTLVIRRDPASDEWIEVSQGLDDAIVGKISAEIARRATYRDIRPFLTRLDVEGRPHDVACLAVHRGESATDLAMELEYAPEAAGLREALMNLIGSALRAATGGERLRRAEELLQADAPTFETLLEMSRELADVTQRASICERILHLVRRELGMSRSALFLWRDGTEGLLALQCVSGFSGEALDRIGLSGFHGIGREIFRGNLPCRLGGLRLEGAPQRESRMLSEAGLQWGAALRIGEHPLGLLLFGVKEGESRLEEAEVRTLRALVGAAAIALHHQDRQEEIQGLLLGSLRGLAAAAEVQRPGDRGHAERVTRLARRVGQALALAPEELQQLSYCALVHDLGRVGLPPEADDDPVRNRLHPVLATRILAGAKPPPAVVKGIEQHHERWDGQGYPYGLRGEDIHVFGRIIAVANAYDRLTHHPTAPLSSPEALRRLELGAGLLWDPGIVAVLAAELGKRTNDADSPSGEISLQEIVGA